MTERLVRQRPATPGSGVRGASAAAVALSAFVGITVARLTDWFPSLHLAMVGGIVVLLLALRLPPLWPPMLRHPGARSVILLVVLAVISIPGSTWPGASAEFVFDVHVKVALTFFLVVLCTRSTADIHVVVLGLLGGLVILAVATLASSAGRASGVTNTYDANDVAFVMGCALPLTLHKALTPGSVLGRASAGLTSLLLLSTIVASQSRGGFVALVVVVAVVGFRLRRHLSGLAVVAVLVIAPMLLSLAPAAYLDRMSTIWAPASAADASYDEGGLWTARWTIWRTGLQLVLENPVVGVGAGAFRIAEGLSHEGVGKWSAPHNSFLEVAAELGLPALLVFTAMLIGAIRACRRVARGMPKPGLAPLGQLASSVEIALYAYIVAGAALSQAYAHVLYVLLGLAATLPRLAGMTLAAPSTPRLVAAGSTWDPRAPARERSSS